MRLVLLGLGLLVGACSMEASIERLSAPEDRAFARAFVEDLRAGRAGRIQAQFDPSLWAQSHRQLGAATRMFPAGAGETKLIGYHVNAHVGTGGSRTLKQYVLVTTDGKRWTETFLATETRNGATAIVAWRVQPYDAPPPNLRQFEQFNAAVPWLRAGAIVLLAAGAALIFWLVRRRRRRRSD